MVLCMAKWKPKQKLEKRDIQILLTEYRVSKNSFHVFLSVCISLIAIVAASSGLALAYPESELFRSIVVLGAFMIFFLSIWALYFRKRALQIAEVLGIEKCLDKYGIEKTL